MKKVQKGNAAYIKNMNKKLVLGSIRANQPTSRVDISKRLNISKPTVSALVDQLIEEGWIYETGNGESTSVGGRKPVHLVFNPDFAYIVGVDIGGTNVVSGIANLDGEIRTYREFSTTDYKDQQLFKRIKADVQAMLEELSIDDDKVLGMGVGVPGITNCEKGVVVESPALQWRSFPIKDRLQELFSFPIYIDNDVNINVLGEHWKGAGSRHSNLIYVAIGTGVGSGILLNGQLYRGSNYSAGEIGYMVTDRQHAANYHPVYEGYGFLESVAGGSSIGTQVSKLLGKPVSAKEAFQLYQQGNKQVGPIIDTAIENLAIAIANYASLFDPEIIILGGGVTNSYPVFEQKLKGIIKRFTPQYCEVVPTTFGKEAGIIGAVALFLKENDLILDI
ncbi:ROK family transcriptional regulator [Radiobacillus deserti]|uniref:ROK family transcriptional regulator n=1 Tax=Radiobacillus deserti TaxID=2594883 RepID=A0A516KJ85_9BACI|nr:ROK family transcriptional regulator [Radiobacillus deserti]QDP41446.1 ROK family transcriptional regulator [Radiobacillus deserti]